MNINFVKYECNRFKVIYVETTVYIMLTDDVRDIQWNILLKVCHLHAKLLNL